MCENNDLHVVTEIGVFGELDVEDPTVNNVKKKNKDVNVDEKLIEDLKEAFNSSYLGAYQDIIDTLTMLQANYDNNEKGLYYLGNGAEYYALLARMYSGNEYTIEDIEDLMLNAFEYYYNDMVSILTSNEQVYKMLFESEPVTSFTTGSFAFTSCGVV